MTEDAARAVANSYLRRNCPDGLLGKGVRVGNVWAFPIVVERIILGLQPIGVSEEGAMVGHPDLSLEFEDHLTIGDRLRRGWNRLTRYKRGWYKL